MTRVGSILAALLIVGSLGGARAAAMPEISECLGGSAVQEILTQGKARRLAEIRRGLTGEIVRADLCRSNGLLVYRVTLLDDVGRVRRVLLDAGTGRMVYDSVGN